MFLALLNKTISELTSCSTTPFPGGYLKKYEIHRKTDNFQDDEKIPLILIGINLSTHHLLKLMLITSVILVTSFCSFSTVLLEELPLYQPNQKFSLVFLFEKNS